MKKMTFYTLKELEKVAQTTKKIPFPIVKDLLKSLCDDGMVQTDRIGTSNYFWSFPSQVMHALQGRKKALATEIVQIDTKIHDATETIALLSKERIDTVATNTC